MTIFGKKVVGTAGSAETRNTAQDLLEYAHSPLEELLERFQTRQEGLSQKEAEERREEYGFNEPVKEKKRGILFRIAVKFGHPLVLVLLIIGGFSLFFGEKVNAAFVFLMAVLSVALSFIQEYRSDQAAEKLRRLVRNTATIYRSGRPREILIREIVPGDVIYLSAGDMVPADLRIISCKDLFVNQATLTGESFPIEKFPTPAPNTNGGRSASLNDIANLIFMGSSVVSGSALALAVKTGPATQFGKLAHRISKITVQTGFDRGVRKFTWVMIRLMLVMVVVIFLVNALAKGNPIQAFLFSIAVAVGLTPEMLPMLVTINLSRGAIAMARKDVIVKRLNSIQNLGAMDVLCTDKTGTLTRDKIVLEKHCDVIRRESDDVLEFAYINSFHQTGLKNILDRAILKYKKMEVESFRKIDEIPFDFSRRIMSVVVEVKGVHRLIAKGAPEEIFKRCTSYQLDDEILDVDNLIITDLKEECDSLSAEGFRVLALAYRDFVPGKETYARTDETELVLVGYVAFLDPPKPSTIHAVRALKKHGVEVKILTGDNELVTRKICSAVGIDVQEIITGDVVEQLTVQELQTRVKTTNIFARLSPAQKEKIINALHDNGHIVGYLGDGINDAPALKTADVGISVNNAVDIAKESADIILLKKNLLVLEDGVLSGRKTFGNITKYIKMGSSSNFGNMFSMTGASFLLPFLPMLPVQILLNNFLYDLSQIAIPTDAVDKEYLSQPRPWDVNSIKNFMLFFGPLSSLFDYLTFAVLWFVFRAPETLFQTGWFLESLLTQTLVIHVIRTGKIPFLESRPSRFLLISSLCIVLAGLLICITPLGQPFGFVRPPNAFLLVLPVIVLAYLSSAQLLKTWFIRKYGYN